MKNLTITYDTLQNGESGEACVSIPMEDEQAERIKAAFEGSGIISKREAFDLRDWGGNVKPLSDWVLVRVYNGNLRR